MRRMRLNYTAPNVWISISSAGAPARWRHCPGWPSINGHHQPAMADRGPPPRASRQELFAAGPRVVTCAHAIWPSTPERHMTSAALFYMRACARHACVRVYKYSHRYFLRFSAPKVWNTLPLYIRQSQSLSTLRRHLKTHYF